MKCIDIGWMKRLDSIYQKQSRTVDSYRKDGRCSMGVLIDRYFKFLEGRTFKLKINDEIYYSLFCRITHTIITDANKPRYYSYGVSFAYAWNNHEFILSFRDEKCKSREFRLHWNDIIKIEYEEVQPSEYWDVVTLFMSNESLKENI